MEFLNVYLYEREWEFFDGFDGYFINHTPSIETLKRGEENVKFIELKNENFIL